METSEIDTQEYYNLCKSFLTYPSIVTKHGIIILLFINEKCSVDEILKEDKKRFEEVNKNLSKLYDLLSGEFILKAPQNIIEENCKKLLDTQNEWESLQKKFHIIENAKTFVLKRRNNERIN